MLLYCWLGRYISATSIRSSMEVPQRTKTRATKTRGKGCFYTVGWEGTLVQPL
jgi:hypothetical protein